MTRSGWILLAAVLVGVGVESRAMASAVEPIFSRDKAFRIPFYIEPAEVGRITEVELLVSKDRGGSWTKVSSAPPAQKWFTFRTTGDGDYWFAVRTTDRQGRLYPGTNSPLVPGLKVIVDSTEPQLALRALRRAGNQIGVEWEARDEALDAGSLLIEFSGESDEGWHRLETGALGAGQTRWAVEGSGPVSVRGRIKDRAGNLAMIQIEIPGLEPATADARSTKDSALASRLQRRATDEPTFTVKSNQPAWLVGETPVNKAPAPKGSAARRSMPRDVEEYEGTRETVPGRASAGGVVAWERPARATAARSVVDTPRFKLNYAVDQVGPSGVGAVELWVTEDGGQSWQRYGEDADRRSPFSVDLGREGTFGLTFVVRNGAGVGGQPPKPGDTPLQWVEVDLTPPDVELYPPQAASDEGSPNVVTVAWSATDKNLAAKPVTLYYNEAPTRSPWQKIDGPLENTGRYVWTVPADVPYRFYVRIEVRDSAGNMETVQTDAPVVLDQSRPIVHIIGVETTDSAQR